MRLAFPQVPQHAQALVASQPAPVRPAVQPRRVAKAWSIPQKERQFDPRPAKRKQPHGHFCCGLLRWASSFLAPRWAVRRSGGSDPDIVADAGLRRGGCGPHRDPRQFSGRRNGNRFCWCTMADVTSIPAVGDAAKRAWLARVLGTDALGGGLAANGGGASPQITEASFKAALAGGVGVLKAARGLPTASPAARSAADQLGQAIDRMNATAKARDFAGATAALQDAQMAARSLQSAQAGSQAGQPGGSQAEFSGGAARRRGVGTFVRRRASGQHTAVRGCRRWISADPGRAAACLSHGAGCEGAGGIQQVRCVL